MEPDPSLPSITPSPPKPCLPRAHHQHRSNQIAQLRLRPNFSPSISSVSQPFPVQHCYLPNYLQQQAELIWMPSSNNALIYQNSSATIPTTPLHATLFLFPTASGRLC